jgi:hypothetical protein
MWSDEQRPVTDATTSGLHRTLVPIGLAWLLAGSLLLRLLFASTGAHFDYYSYQLVADLSLQGKNFYAETHRYNYAPFWGWWVTLLRWLLGSWFRYGVLVTLVAADLYFITWLYRRGNKIPAILWGLLPLQAVITGYQNQFDILGIVPAFIAVAMLERNIGEDGRYHSGKVVVQAALLLGLSLCLKHIYIFFPIWLFLRTPDRRQRSILLVLPLAIFAISFLPMIPHNGGGIRSHVLGYTSGVWHNFWAEVIPTIIQRFDKSLPGFPIRSAIFFAFMLGAGLLLRKRPLMESLLLYGVCLFISGTGRFIHYYTFLLPFLIINRNWWSWITMVYGSVMILTAENGTLWTHVRTTIYSNGIERAFWAVHTNWDLVTSFLLILTWITNDYPNIWKNSMQKFGNQLRNAVLYGKT